MDKQAIERLNTAEMRDKLAKAIAFAGRSAHDKSNTPDEFWKYTGGENRATARDQADAAFDVLRALQSQAEGDET